jgi:hypothetical protein
MIVDPQIGELVEFVQLFGRVGLRSQQFQSRDYFGFNQRFRRPRLSFLIDLGSNPRNLSDPAPG